MIRALLVSGFRRFTGRRFPRFPRRLIRLTCVALLLCTGLVGQAMAGKPKIAVLGLEAAPGPSGAVDPATTQVAREITKELRQRAQSGASPYTLAPNSSKELTDEKLLMSCDNEKVDCMAVIGAGLQADTLMYGRVERKADVYRISLKLLDVKARTVETGSDELAVGAAAPAVAKRLYAKLIGDTPSGVAALVIRASTHAGTEVRTGRVMIDEEAKGDLSSGKLTVTGIPEGRHTIAIEAPGFRRFEEIITLRNGEQLPVNAVLLDKAPLGKVPSKDPAADGGDATSPWKYVFVSSIIVGAVGGGISGYALYKEGQAAKGARAGNELCGHSPPFNMPSETQAFLDACHWDRVNIYVGVGTAVVAGSAFILSGYMLLHDSGKSAPERSARSVSIVPVVGPDGGGAQLSLTW